MKMSRKIVLFFLTFAILIGIVSENVISVKAEDASVTFGSGYYENNSGNTFPVGVYITAEDTVGSYYIELKYDNRRLKYVSGADWVEDDILILEGVLNASEYRYWIEFEAISGGTADIQIITADIELQNSNTGEMFTITEMGQAPIYLSGVDLVVVATEAPTEQMTEDDSQDSQTGEKNENSQSEDTDSSDKESKPSIYIILLVVVLVLVFLLIVFWIVYAQLKKQRRMRSLAARRVAATKAATERMPSPRKVSSVDRDSHRTQVTETKAEPDTHRKVSANSLKAAVAEVRATSTSVASDDFDFDQIWSQVVKEVETLGIDLGKGNTEVVNQEEAKEEQLGQPIIRVEYVTMRYKISTSNASGLKEYIIQRMKHQVSYRTLKALDNVSFNVYKGEVVGIIGTNGSGKSTLLKIISGALKPTKGKVQIDRRKLQLLTLGTGFDAELTARENVYLNGSIIGYTKEFLDAHYNDIVEFAELQDFMDEKVKNFSSGMVSRLGFAIATAGDAAEILILDEILAVGDEFFRKKSLARIKEMIHGGSTVLIVSHNMQTIVENCSKVVWIEKGELMMVGDPKVVCKAYRNQHAAE